MTLSSTLVINKEEEVMEVTGLPIEIEELTPYGEVMDIVLSKYYKRTDTSEDKLSNRQLVELYDLSNILTTMIIQPKFTEELLLEGFNTVREPRFDLILDFIIDKVQGIK